MTELSQDAQKLIDEKHLAHVATLMKDGSAQVSPVWVDHDGTHILVNTAEGRQKPRNLRRDARVAVSIVDHENSFRYLLVRGKVTEITTDGAWDHIHKLNLKYTGSSDYPKHEGQVRLVIKILPEHEFFSISG